MDSKRSFQSIFDAVCFATICTPVNLEVYERRAMILGNLSENEPVFHSCTQGEAHTWLDQTSRGRALLKKLNIESEAEFCLLVECFSGYVGTSLANWLIHLSQIARDYELETPEFFNQMKEYLKNG